MKSHSVLGTLRFCFNLFLVDEPLVIVNAYIELAIANFIINEQISGMPKKPLSGSSTSVIIRTK